MAYSTTEDIIAAAGEEKLAQWTDDEAGATVDDVRTDAAIADADSLIDSYCSARYIVPFSPVPKSIRRASVAIAIKYIASRRSFTLTEGLQKAYDEAIAWLRDVARGLANITDAQAPEAAPQAFGSYSAEGRIMTRDKMSGF